MDSFLGFFPSRNPEGEEVVDWTDIRAEILSFTLAFAFIVLSSSTIPGSLTICIQYEIASNHISEIGQNG
ncbi:MAG: hypothetical protein KAR39_00265 [Thermoplasmata archaeon]|nr:hypothetical protein [Thermoplasmata archaeon]